MAAPLHPRPCSAPAYVAETVGRCPRADSFDNFLLPVSEAFAPFDGETHLGMFRRVRALVLELCRTPNLTLAQP